MGHHPKIQRCGTANTIKTLEDTIIIADSEMGPTFTNLVEPITTVRAISAIRLGPRPADRDLDLGLDPHATIEWARRAMIVIFNSISISRIIRIIITRSEAGNMEVEDQVVE